MPIYAYRCTTCGHAQDVLQKISDAVLSVCPACGAATYAKQVTAAGFQLKGSGWYVTDFRGGKTEAPAKPEGDAAKPAETADGKPAEKAPEKATAETKPAEKATTTTPAPAPSTPATPPSSGS